MSRPENLLTMCVPRIAENLSDDWCDGYENVVLNITCENQQAFSLFLTGLLKLLFHFIPTAPQIYVYTILLSISGGGLTVLFFIMWADVFGRRAEGR